MKPLLRFDAVKIGKPVRTAEGYLKTTARVAQVGILEYPRKDGTIYREFVSPEVLHEQASMDSLSLLPVTDEHPSKNVDSKTVKYAMKGVTGQEARKDGTDGLDTDIVIMDADLVESAERGDKQEVSAGYTCLLDETPGIWQGQKYDAKQIERRYNHIAVVPEGRAGKNVRLRMDAAHNLTLEEDMVTIKLDGKEYQVEQSVADALKAAGAATAKADAAKEAAEGALEGVQAKLDTKEAELKKVKGDSASAEAEAAIQARIDQKVHLIGEAKKFIKADALEAVIKLDALGIMKACIMAAQPEAKLDGKSADYIQARFDVLKPETEAREDGKDDLGAQLAANREDAAGGGAAQKKSPEALHEEHMDSLQNAWKKPLNAKVAA